MSAHVRDWIYLINPILVAMEKGYEVSYTLIQKHFAALQARRGDNPRIAAMATAFEPLYNGFIREYNAWRNQQNNQLTNTRMFRNLMDNMTARVDRWWKLIDAQYVDNPEGFRAIFPHGKAPFGKSLPQNERITAIATLKQQTAGIAALEAVNAEIAEYHEELMRARETKDQNINNTSIRSENVEDAARAAGVRMYANLGALIELYPEQQDRVAVFFDLEILRSGMQKRFVDSRVPAERKEFIAERALTPNVAVRIINNGPAVLRFWFAMNKEGAEGTEFVDIAPGMDTTVNAGDLGSEQGRFLFVQNRNEAQDGAYVLEIE